MLLNVVEVCDGGGDGGAVSPGQPVGFSRSNINDPSIFLPHRWPTPHQHNPLRSVFKLIFIPSTRVPSDRV